MDLAEPAVIASNFKIGHFRLCVELFSSCFFESIDALIGFAATPSGRPKRLFLMAATTPQKLSLVLESLVRFEFRGVHAAKRLSNPLRSRAPLAGKKRTATIAGR
jgi:hypothetical protein